MLNHEYQINVRYILGAFMIGTGVSDIGRLLMMTGVNVGGSFERPFYRSASFVQRKIINRCKLIVEEALREEIILTIEEP